MSYLLLARVSDCEGWMVSVGRGRSACRGAEWLSWTIRLSGSEQTVVGQGRLTTVLGSDSIVADRKERRVDSPLVRERSGCLDLRLSLGDERRFACREARYDGVRRCWLVSAMTVRTVCLSGSLSTVLLRL